MIFFTTSLGYGQMGMFRSMDWFEMDEEQYPNFVPTPGGSENATGVIYFIPYAEESARNSRFKSKKHRVDIN